MPFERVQETVVMGSDNPPERKLLDKTLTTVSLVVSSLPHEMSVHISAAKIRFFKFILLNG